MEILCLIISLLTICLLMLSVIFIPKVKVGKWELQTFWMASLIGIILLFVFGIITFGEALNGIFKEGAINPIKILLLFFSMTIMSIVLDEQGFFSYLASVVARKCQKSQKMLLICFYLCISILTVFTSNDIIVLTFTPFICSLCKNLKINPIPYLVSEFIAANTLSMMLVIGNPTNIYLAQSYGVTFFEYLKVMAVPTIISCVVALALLLLIFRKDLVKPLLASEVEEVKIKNKTMTYISLAHLIVCIIILAISNYVDLEMYLISVILCLSLTLIIGIHAVITKKFTVIVNSYKRVPYSLAIFIISMFIIVLSLEKYGYLSKIGNAINNFGNDIFSYGVLSFLTCNVTNNIPMSVMFSEMLISTNASKQALYATIIGSNIGAYFTPLGALAGIMWLDLLNRNDVDLSFKRFIKLLMPISICILTVSLLFLALFM